MTRRSWTPRRRLALFEAHKGLCHICSEKIDGTRERWDVEHLVPIALGGDDDEGNAAPAHERCHKIKTATDKAQIAKANRVRAKHNGARNTNHSFHSNKKSKWKKKISGEVVPR